jgi:hypothetical protein
LLPQPLASNRACSALRMVANDCPPLSLPLVRPEHVACRRFTRRRMSRQARATGCVGGQAVRVRCVLHRARFMAYSAEVKGWVSAPIHKGVGERVRLEPQGETNGQRRSNVWNGRPGVRCRWCGRVRVAAGGVTRAGRCSCTVHRVRRPWRLREATMRCMSMHAISGEACAIVGLVRGEGWVSHAVNVEDQDRSC